MSKLIEFSAKKNGLKPQLFDKAQKTFTFGESCWCYMDIFRAPKSQIMAINIATWVEHGFISKHQSVFETIHIEVFLKFHKEILTQGFLSRFLKTGASEICMAWIGDAFVKHTTPLCEGQPGLHLTLILRGFIKTNHKFFQPPRL